MRATVEDLFAELIELAPAERDAVLRLHPEASPTVRREVLELIADCETAERQLLPAAGRLAPEGGLRVGDTVGDYELETRIGAGGMGEVWLAKRSAGDFEHRVALKVVDASPGLTARFLQERRILAGLQHPNIAQLLDGGLTAGGQPYMALEYVAGEAITSYCERQALGTEARLRLFLKVCSAVDYAHRNLVVHRDLKPANILVDGDGEVKLLDFGIAKWMKQDHSLTIAGRSPFTPDYASPEQIRGEAITTATDIYSLGAILYELLRGRGPHELAQYTPHELTEVICHRPAPALGLGNDLDAVAAQALHKEPERRYRSVAALAADVESFLEHRPVHARGDSLWYRGGKFVRRHAVATVAAVLAVASLGVGLGVATWQARRAERRFGEVRKLARTVLFDFDEKIRTLPGATPARALLSRTAVEYLDQLAKDATGDDLLRKELAAAYEKVADVQGEPGRPNLGQRKNAAANYEKAEKMTADPLAQARLKLKRHAILGTRALLEVALGAAEQAYRNQPGETAAVKLLFDALLAAGLSQANRSEFEAALMFYQRAEGLLAKEGETGVRVGLLLRRGDAQLRNGDAVAALATLSEARELNQQALSDKPEDVGLLRRAFKIDFLRGHALGNPEYIHLGRTKEATQAYEAAAAISRRLFEADPGNALARGDAADAAWAMAVTIAATQPERARELLSESVRDAKANVDHSPTTLAFLHNYANSQYALARVERQLGRRREAGRLVDNAIALHRQIIAARPQQQGLRHNLILPLVERLHGEMDRGAREEAGKTWEEIEALLGTVDQKAANFRSKALDVIAAYEAGWRLRGGPWGERARTLRASVWRSEARAMGLVR